MDVRLELEALEGVLVEDVTLGLSRFGGVTGEDSLLPKELGLFALNRIELLRMTFPDVLTGDFWAVVGCDGEGGF